MQIFMRRYGVIDVSAGTDDPIFAFPIPGGCVQNYMKGEFHFLGPILGLPCDEIIMYGLEGWILKSDDFTDFQTIANLWDAMVPKDDGVVELDDDFANDADNFFEPGLVNPSQLFDQELLGPERVFQRQQMLTIANASFAAFIPGTPNKYIPSQFVPISVMKKYRVMDDSALLWGISSPNIDALTTNDDTFRGTTLAVDGFYIMRYITDFLDKAMVDLVGGGLTESGAESPYEDIMDFLLLLLESPGRDSSVADWSAITWSIAGKMTGGCKVTGSLVHTTLGPDAQA